MTPDGDRYELRTALTLVDRMSLQLAETKARPGATMQWAHRPAGAFRQWQLPATQEELAGQRELTDQARAEAQSLRSGFLTSAAGASIRKLSEVSRHKWPPLTTVTASGCHGLASPASHHSPRSQYAISDS